MSVPFPKITEGNTFSSPPVEAFSDPLPLFKQGIKKMQVNETNIVKIYLYMHQILDV